MGIDQLSPESTRSGSYDGDGSTNGREISVGIHANAVIVSEQGAATSWIALGSNSSVQLAPGLTSEVQSSSEVRLVNGNLLVGDGGSTANESGTTYDYTAIR